MMCENCRRMSLPMNAGKRFPCILSLYRVTLAPMLRGPNPKQDLIAFMRRRHDIRWTLVIIKEFSNELAIWYEKLAALS